MSKEPLDQTKGQLFLFEDIMREYGNSGTTALPKIPEPKAPEAEPSAETSAPPVKKPNPALSQTQPKIIPLPDWTEQEPPAPTQDAPPAKAKRERQPPKEMPAEPVVEMPPAMTLQEANKQLRNIGTLRCRLVGFLAFIAVALTLAQGLEQPLGALNGSPQTLPMVLLGLLLLSTCLALDVVKDGFFYLISGKIRLDILLSVAVVVFIIHGFTVVDQGALPYGAIGILGLFYGLSAKSLESRSKKRIYRGLISLRESPSAIHVSSQVLENCNGVHKMEGSIEDVVAPLEADSKPQRLLGIYGIIALALSLAAALVLTFWKGDSFLAIWAAILAGSLPAYGLVAFWKPFWKATGQLAKNGAVLCGWNGVHSLGKKPKLVTTEQDLFTGNQVSVNGMKVYPEYEVRQIIGYVYAIVKANGGGLASVFESLFQQQNGRDYTIGEFKRYDNGGLGGEIQSDVVLVGSLGFMRVMSVKMPEGANLRKAVYCSVNGELAGVFALQYIPSAMVKNALHTYVRSGGAGLILATRDFILTPGAIGQLYKVPPGWMEYPPAQARADLADSQLEPGTTAGLMARSGFGTLVETAMAGQVAYSRTMIILSLSLIWGVCGLLLTSAVSFLGAYSVASPFNLTVFSLLWIFAAWALSLFQRK